MVTPVTGAVVAALGTGWYEILLVVSDGGLTEVRREGRGVVGGLDVVGAAGAVVTRVADLLLGGLHEQRRAGGAVHDVAVAAEIRRVGVPVVRADTRRRRGERARDVGSQWVARRRPSEPHRRIHT